jgi:catechol 2,3-dioxygenase-like lactoylglutathione lyase family enzyme
MLGPVKTVGIYVDDQNKALDFYTRILSFTLRRSIPMSPALTGSKYRHRARKPVSSSIPNR